MDSVCAAVLRAFDLKGKSAVRGKAGFVCATDAGAVDVLRAGQPPERIWFRHAVQEHLHQSGFTGAGRLRLTAEGEPFTITAGEIYVVQPHMPHREVRFTDAEEWRRTLRAVGRMHALLRDADFPYAPVYDPPDADSLHRKHMDALNGYKKRILKKGKYSEFDVLFLRMADEQAAALAAWHEAARSPLYDEQAAEARARRFVCHNLLKEENLLAGGDEVYVRNFAECAPGHPADDLAALLRRYVKAVPDAPVSFAESLEIYSAENPLSDGMLAYLRAALAFPDKFLKLCAKYYDRNRTWTPGAFTARMEETARGLRDLANYV